MSPVLIEASERGLTRIEISYISDSPEAVKKIFSNFFLVNAMVDLETMESCINLASEICYSVSLKDLLHTFQMESRYNQLFIRLPHTAAIIYCMNSKRGSYCGNIYDIPVRGTFSTEEFLAKHALAGPGSQIKCVLMAQGINGNVEHCFYQKKHALCQIPGFKYGNDHIFPLPKPKEWMDY